jgi:hypothetical protein
MDALNPRIAANRRRERGSAFIETAFALPVIVLLLFGLADFSMVFRDYLAASNAARAAVRAPSLMAEIPCNPGVRRQAGEAVIDTRLAGLNLTRVIQHAELNNGELCTRGLIGATVQVTKPLPFLNGFFAGTAFPPVTFTVSAFAMNENGN